MLLFLAAALLCASELSAQVSVKVATDRPTYLQYEEIFVKVSLRNYSGKALVFGESEEMKGEINFIIDTPNRTVAEMRKKRYNPMIGVVLPPGGSEDVLIPVSRLYNISSVGSYNLRAVVKHKLLSATYDSNSISFTVSNGKVEWERLVGVPELFRKKGDSDEPRTVKLVSFYDGKGKVYCLVIEDKFNVYGVARIGYDIGGNKPECEVDGLCRTHILLPVSPNLYSYYCHNINCNLQEREAYLKTDSRPTLVLNAKDGTVEVVGGKKAIKDVDYTETDGAPVFEKDKEPK